MFRGMLNAISNTLAEKQVKMASASQRDRMVAYDHTRLFLFLKALCCFSTWFFVF